MFNKFFDVEEFDYELEKKKFVDNMNFLKSMSVQEITLYKKWEEFNKDSYAMLQKASKFDILENTIWMPSDIYNKEQTIKEIESISPIVEVVEQGNPRDSENWTLLRRLVHTMEFTANPGRNVKFYVKDKNTDKVLGVVCLGSDVTSLGARDNYIGWTKENKFKDGKLNHTSIGTTICCVQPLGFNFLGGKLVAAMVTSKVVRDTWKKLYNQTLVGLSTTSLYGIHSMYNGIPHWKTLGESSGRISLKPDDSAYDVWHEWIKKNKPEEYKKATTAKDGVSGPVTGVKQKIIKMIYDELGLKLKTFEHGFQRGIYFADIYENGRPFLRGEIEEKDLVMKKKYDENIEYIERWWKPKAIRRYTKLLEQDKIKPEKLFYGDILNTTWEDTKKKYLGEVGR